MRGVERAGSEPARGRHDFVCGPVRSSLSTTHGSGHERVDARQLSSSGSIRVELPNVNALTQLNCYNLYAPGLSFRENSPRPKRTATGGVIARRRGADVAHARPVTVTAPSPVPSHPRGHMYG